MPAADRGGKVTPFSHQEAIGSYTECGVMMEAAPAASLKVAQSEFLFQFLVVAFDDPALFGQSDKVA